MRDTVQPTQILPPSHRSPRIFRTLPQNASYRPYSVWLPPPPRAVECVQLGDSGADLDSCYLADPQFNSSSYAKLWSGSPSRLRMPQHRKVVQYVLVPGEP